MEFLLLGFFTGLSLILAIGAQNIFVIEQGLKKQHVFLNTESCISGAWEFRNKMAPHAASSIEWGTSLIIQSADYANFGLMVGQAAQMWHIYELHENM